MTDIAIPRRRTALIAFFTLFGVIVASWVTRIPDIRTLLQASTAEMGLVLFGLSVGSMTGILSAATLVKRFGTRPFILYGISVGAAAVALVGLGATLHSAPLAFVGFLCFGLVTSVADVSINVEGNDVERKSGRPLLPVLHGSFSLGTVIGALVGMALTAVAFPVGLHLLIAAALAIPVVALGIRAVAPGVGREPRRAKGSAERGPPVWKDRTLWLIGIIVLAMALAEGSANDWLPLLMVDGHGVDPALGSLVYTGFAAAMTIGRFGGSFFLVRFGRVHVVRASAILGAIGLAIVIFVDSAVAAGFAVLLWGIGASLGFPVTLSAAGDSGPNPTARVGMVASAGYFAFLVGPPGLGFLGEHFGLRAAMIAVLILMIAAIFLTPALGKRGRPGDEPLAGH